MNKIFKIKLNPISQTYHVCSELAKRAGKVTGHIAGIMTVTILSVGVAESATATNPPGDGLGIAVGTGSSAPKAENVAVGTNAKIAYSNGASNATGDIAVGNGTNINNYASQGGSIAVGSNAKIENMAGGAEASFAFGQTTYSGNFFSSSRIPADPTKAMGSIAIGQNSFARTGSTMIGTHNYKGALGDTEVDSASTRTSNLNVYATTIGSNSHSNGAFTTTTGVYNIISSKYNGGRMANPVKNLGATVYGSLNSIESMTGNNHAGIANSVTGIANRVANSNGALVYGAGNTIENSVTTLSGVPTSSGDSAKAFQDTLIKNIQKNKSGGSTMAFGGGNTANYTLRSSMIGVNNTLTGTSSNQSQENLITGFQNTATNVDNTTIIGTSNTVTDSSKNIVIGDNHKVTGKSNNVIIGSADAEQETTVDEVVSIGHNALANIKNSVALGAKSTTLSASNTTKGADAYQSQEFTINGVKKTVNFAGGNASGVVSVGNVGSERRIQNVAAGLISNTSTDAINGSQLYAAMSQLYPALSIYSKGTATVNGVTVNTYTAGTQLPTAKYDLSKLSFDFGNGLYAAEKDNGDGTKTVFVGLDKETLKNDPNFKGPKGDKGDQGLPGEKGAKGDKGDQGLPGEKGAKGDKGDQGLPGEKGAKGDKGDQGLPGEKGAKGDKGDQGLPGEKGAKGDKGDQGLPGEKGAKGDKGDQGLPGEKGAKGDKGDRGLPGEKGAKGDKGDQGLPGEKGAKGDKGDRGLPGEKGAKGDKGDQGLPGEKGAKGDKGDPGSSASGQNKEETVVAGDNNINVTNQPNNLGSKEYKVGLNKDIKVNSVTAKVVNSETVNAKEVNVGDTKVTTNGVTIKNGPSVTKSGIDAGSKKITNVADGTISATSKDAVNGSQLHAVDQRVTKIDNSVRNINNRVSNVEAKVSSTRKEMRGIGANAAAGMSLPQVYTSGKSMVSAAVGAYKDQSAVAVGWSRASDNGKVIIKLTGTANTVGDVSAGAGVGFQY